MCTFVPSFNCSLSVLSECFQNRCLISVRIQIDHVNKSPIVIYLFLIYRYNNRNIISSMLSYKIEMQQLFNSSDCVFDVHLCGLELIEVVQSVLST